MKQLVNPVLNKFLIRLSRLFPPFCILFLVSLPVWVQLSAPHLGAATTSSMVPVPNLVGRNKSQAPAILNEVHLRPGRAIPQASQQPPDTIVRQAPPPGQRVRAGTLVNFWFSTGPQPTNRARVPNLIRSNEQQARALLRKARLRLGSIARDHSNLPQGLIFRQSPVAGQQAESGSPVNVWVSTGSRQNDLVRVPSLVRRNEQQAREILANAHLELRKVSERQSNLPQGSIVGQSPAAGQQVKAGSPVDVWVSLGPVQVPNLIGLESQHAQELLGQVRLQMVLADHLQGPIVRQAPSAGQMVPRGSSVRVWRRAAPPPQVVVPRLIGHQEGEAREILDTKNLGVGRVTRREDREPAGTIIGQTPAPGTQVNPRMWVSLVVSEGQPLTPPLTPDRMRVPEVRGLPLEQAERLLREARFTLGRVEERTSSRPRGTVTGQSPRPGTLLLSGQPVNLVVAGTTPPPNGVSWQFIILVISVGLGAAGGAYGIYKIISKPALPVLKVRVVQRLVPPAVASDSSRLADLEVRLRPLRDPGQQSVSIETGGPLILEERKENE